MLRYLSRGARLFAARPIEPHVRLNWEFYVVLEGKCGVSLESGRLPLKTRHLWIFPPQHRHGWHGDPRPCEVAVFHFGMVPPQLESIVREKGFFERDLLPGDCAKIEDLAGGLRSDFERPTVLSEMRFHRALLDLALIALSGEPAREMATTERRIADKVDAAVEWFTLHLREKPNVLDVARAVHVSTSHLRRLFIADGRGRLHDTLNKIQINEAMRLMRESDLKLDSVATEVGFASASDFSRSFKARHGCSPREWRMTSLPPYRNGS